MSNIKDLMLEIENEYVKHEVEKAKKEAKKQAIARINGVFANNNPVEINEVIVPIAEIKYYKAISENDYKEVVKWAELLSEYKIVEDEIVTQTLEEVGVLLDDTTTNDSQNIEIVNGEQIM